MYNKSYKKRTLNLFINIIASGGTHESLHLLFIPNR